MTRTKPLRFRDESNMDAYVFVAAEEEDTHEPLTYQDVIACEDSSKWKADMKKEMDSLRKNKTWELVDYLARQKLVSCKWLFKIKEGIEGVQKPRYKASLVARGFTQSASTTESGSTKSLLKKEFDMKELREAKKILGDEKGVVCKCDCELNVLDGVHETRHSVCGLVYRTDRGNHVDITGFVDSDYARDPDKEYMALTEVVKEAIWLRGLLEELGMKLNTVAV
ncbi:retrovirus-related pol polyprotein from transposon TNT 1-94 [Tanacetum coccineum]